MGKKILIAAEYAGVSIEAPLTTESGDAASRLPVLETEKGCIFSTIPIARYLARVRRDQDLYGQNLLESGQVDSWVEFGTRELEVPLGAWIYSARGVATIPPDVAARAKDDVVRRLTVLNNHLLHFTYMVGHQITLADICL